MRTPSILAALVLATVCHAPHASADPGAGDFTRTLTIDGYVRDYDVHVPPTYTGTQPVPLVLDFHGLNATKAHQRALSGFLAKSNAEGFIVVYPQGFGNSWNAGTICCGQAWQQQLDDVALARAIVADLDATWNIDRRRVYSTGVSNGGALSQRLACEASDLFAAVAPVSYPLSLIPASLCQPARPIHVMHFHGLNDQLVPYNGNGLTIPVAESFADWASINHCTDTAATVLTAGPAYCERYQRCASDVTNTLCTLDAGHLAYINPDVVIADTAWAELSKFTLPVPIGGQSLKLTDAPTTGKRTFTFTSKDVRIDASALTGMNPTTTGATVQVYDTAGSGESACAVLPAGGLYWHAASNGFSYSDPKAAAGPCTKARIKSGKQLKLTCKGLNYTLDEPHQTRVAVRFAAGSLAYCAEMGGVVTVDSGTSPPNPGGKGTYKAKLAAPPTACPPAPPCP